MLYTAYRHLATAYTYSIESASHKTTALIVGELEQCLRNIPTNTSALYTAVQQLQKNAVTGASCDWANVLNIMQQLCLKERCTAHNTEYDILIPLKANGSYSNNIELLYALRSIYMHLKGYRYIWIVGESIPEWVVGVRFIRQVDRYQNKQANIHTAILSVMQHSECADNVIFWADDNVLLKDINATDIPITTNGTDLLDCDANGVWWDRTRKATGIALQEKGYTTVDYEAHTPVVFNKHKYLQLASEFDFYANPNGLCYISMYLNRYEHRAVSHISSVKATWTSSNSSIDNKLFIGYSDVGISNKIVKVLNEQFPDASLYEYLPDTPYDKDLSVGVVLGVAGNPDLVELQLYYLCVVNKLPVLVHDDIEIACTSTKAVIDKYVNEGYDVTYTCTETKLGHLRGDIDAVAEGLKWAANRSIDLLFKVSARWVILREWATELTALAKDTEAITLSSYTTSYNKGFRSEFFGMNVAAWYSMYDKIKAYTKQPADEKTISGRTVERILHVIAMSLAKTHATYTYMYKMAAQGIDKQQQGYILIPLMGTDRKKPTADILWHDAYTHNEEIDVYAKALNEIKTKGA